ncbi:MAG: transporter substrate-binding domain-containing protein, partial [Thermodesulfobacteriota bacterium]
RVTSPSAFILPSRANCISYASRAWLVIISPDRRKLADQMVSRTQSHDKAFDPRFKSRKVAAVLTFSWSGCAAWACMAVLTAVLLYCDQAVAGPVFDRVGKSGTVRFGVPYNRIPQGFLDPSGQLVGFEVDLAQEMARRIGRKLDMVKVGDRNWGPLLSEGKIDAAMCRVRHTRSLESAFDFSVPYFFDAPHILVVKGKFKNPTELKGQKIAAVQGTIGEREAMRILKQAGDEAAEKNVISYPDRPSCFMALGREKVAAWIDSGMILLEYLSKKTGRFELLRASDTVEGVAVALPQNDSAWRDLVNFTIQDMASDGTLKKIYQKWYGPDTPYAFPMMRDIEIWPD